MLKISHCGIDKNTKMISLTVRVVCQLSFFQEYHYAYIQIIVRSHAGR